MSETRAATLLRRWGDAAIALCFAVAFAPTLGHELVWDDSVIVESQARFADLGAGLRSSQTDQLDEVRVHTAGHQTPYDSYRPLLFASYRLDHALFGLAPWAMHLHSLLVGLLNVALFALLLRPLELPRAFALALTAAFALHPLQIEAVSYVSARGDLLAATFALLTMLAVQWSVQGGRGARHVGAALAGACLMLSMFAKETYAALPLAVAVFAFALHRLRAALPSIAGMALFGMLYGAIRLAVLGSGGSHAGRDGPAELVLRLAGMVGQSVQVVVLPLDLSIHRGASDDFLVLGIFVLAAGVVAVLARDTVSRPVTLTGAAALSLYAALAPSAVAVGSFGILSDRYLYAAVPLVLLPFALLVHAATMRVRRVAYGVATVWGVICLLVWPGAARAWRSELTLFSHAVLVAPERTESWYRLGQLLAHRGDFTGAGPLLERAIAIDPANQRARNNLGVVRLNQGRYAEAARELEVTLQLTGGKHYKACFNRSLALLGLGQREQACAQLRVCTAVNPAYERARKALREHCGVP